MATAQASQARQHELLERAVVLPHDFLRVLHRGHHRGRLLARRDATEKRVVHGGCLPHISLQLEQARLVQERRIEARVRHQGTLDRRALAGRVTAVAPGKRNVQPQHRALRLALGGPLEERQRAAHVALA